MASLTSLLSDSYKNQIILCTTLMILIPMSSFFYLRSYLTDLWIGSNSPLKDKALVNLQSDVDMWSALGSIVVVQCLIMLIVIVKYYDDILDVFCRGRGHLEYSEDGTTRNVHYKDYKPPKIRLNNKLYEAGSGFE